MALSNWDTIALGPDVCPFNGVFTHEKTKSHMEIYKNSGWRVAVVWECALKGRHRLDSDDVLERLSEWIQGTEKHLEISGHDTNQGI